MFKSEPRNELTLETAEEPAVYRAEIRTNGPKGPKAWLLGNAIYVRAPQVLQAPRSVPVRMETALFDGKTDGGWHLETDPASKAAVDVGPTLTGFELRYRYTLAERFERRQSVGGVGVGHTDWPCAHQRRRLQSPDVYRARGAPDADLRPATHARDRPPASAVAAFGVSGHVRPGTHCLSFKDIVPSVGTDPGKPLLNQVSQDPVRRRYDQHEAGQLRTVLDQQRGVSEVGLEP